MYIYVSSCFAIYRHSCLARLLHITCFTFNRLTLELNCVLLYIIVIEPLKLE